MMKSNVMKSNIMKDGMMIFTQSQLTTLWDAFHIKNEVCLCMKDAKTGWYFLCCHYDQTPGSVHHGKSRHQAFLECTVLIRLASRRWPECETPVCLVGPSAVSSIACIRNI